jgi:hypothetical protein
MDYDEDISERDLFDAIAQAWHTEASQTHPGFLTTTEISEVMGWSRDKTLKALRRIKKMGRLIVGHKIVENLAGQNQPIPAFRIRRDDDV